MAILSGTMSSRLGKLTLAVLGCVLVAMLAALLWWQSGEATQKPQVHPAVVSKINLSLSRKKVLLYAEAPFSFAWSPDAKQLALADRGLNIFLYDLQTGKKGPKLFGPKIETTYGWLGGISWGRNRILTLSAGTDEQTDIYFLNEDGSQAYPFTPGFFPVWLGGQHRVLYQTGSPLEWIISEIWLLDLETGSRQKLCNGITPVALDETRFVYRKLDPELRVGHGLGLWLFDVGTKEEVQLTNDATDSPSTVAWNRYVMFLRGERQYELCVLDLRTGEQAKLLGEECLEAAVSPLGQTLLCWTKTADDRKYALTLFELQRQKATQ